MYNTQPKIVFGKCPNPLEIKKGGNSKRASEGI